MPERAMEETAAAAKRPTRNPEPETQAHISAPGPVWDAGGARVPPTPGAPSAVLSIQRAAGNQAVMRMLDARRPGHSLAGPAPAIQALRDDELDDDDVQRVSVALPEPSDEAIRSAAADGVRTPSTTLPHLDRIQASFGRHSITHVQAHVGPEATRASRAMNALAYASGDHVVFGSTPDLRTAAHEAAHIVQQQAGVQLSGGIGRAGDPYERHADAVADAVVAGRSAEALMEPFGASVSTAILDRADAPKHKAIQKLPRDLKRLEVGLYVRFVYLNRKLMGRVESVTENGVTIEINGKKEKFKNSDINGFGFKIVTTSATMIEIPNPVEQDLHLPTPRSINDHLVEPRQFEREFTSATDQGALSRVRALAAVQPGVNENFTCDPYAESLQSALDQKTISYTPLLIVIDAIAGPADNAITLKHRGHPFNERQIGFDSHTATAIKVGAAMYVFDNHHPDGVEINDFVSSLEFCSSFVPRGETEKIEKDHKKLLQLGDVKVFIMKAADVRRRGSTWRPSLLDMNPKYEKAFGTKWSDFASLVPPPNLENILPNLYELDLRDKPEVTVSYYIRELIHGRQWVNVLRANNSQVTPDQRREIRRALPDVRIIVHDQDTLRF